MSALAFKSIRHREPQLRRARQSAEPESRDHFVRRRSGADTIVGRRHGRDPTQSTGGEPAPAGRELLLRNAPSKTALERIKHLVGRQSKAQRQNRKEIWQRLRRSKRA